MNFYLYIKESISYNSIYLICGIYTNFCTFLWKMYDVWYYVINHDDDDDWWPASLYSFNFIIMQNSQGMPKLNTRNCSINNSLMYAKKFISFCQVLKTTQTKERGAV